ncbi:MAG: OsmC family protein [Crocinitomicaceae bacterium]|nr:OsmC family protein [Crocinitomicaceae bacterium]
MKLEFKRIEEPYVFQLENETGVVTHLDASDTIGGKNKGLRPMEMLAGSIAGCAAIDILAILKKQRVRTEKFEIEIKGKRSAASPSIFEWVHLNILVDDHVDQVKLKKTVDLVLEKYCSVSASLNKNIIIKYSINEELDW